MSIDWSQIFTWQNLMNLIDILAVWFFIYKMIMLLKGTKAVQLFNGIIIIVAIKAVSYYLNLHTVSYIMDQVINWAVVVLVIIFQPEIRRALERLGRNDIFGGSHKTKEDTNHLIDGLDKAIQYMSKRRIGALITIQMQTGLEDYIETGIPLDADVSGELLINIFIPNTPLHDGAVIIRDNKIAVAAAYLPLSESNMIPKELGTRHRAAVGISEVTDAVTLVVSEETGAVTITKNSQLMHDLSREDYLKFLHVQLDSPEKENTWWQNVLDFFKPKKGGAKK
ncbi:diadenylate cyclase CdaA [Lapidilactobacillus gannanensis]|uniref:Diadenylate cyclase n=1 Tax=Lapidilactobacillus gannanensis TaxID=2486002 RepID=A0ABW4BQM8_9LACO|nr:diadenylate cyclase CdaA [Lapidilactobacillus gannanensis]MCH4057706.1 diadenylate cyclase CdaA [Lactobacillaceae bacterium]